MGSEMCIRDSSGRAHRYCPRAVRHRRRPRRRRYSSCRLGFALLPSSSSTSRCPPPVRCSVRAPAYRRCRRMPCRCSRTPAAPSIEKYSSYSFLSPFPAVGADAACRRERYVVCAKLLQKSEMRKNMVMDLIYRGFIYAANYSESHYNPRRSQIKTELRYLFVTTPNR